MCPWCARTQVPTGTEVSIEEDVKKGTTVVHVSVVGFADKCFMRTGHLQKTKPGAADAYADVDSDAEILDSPEKAKVGKSRLGNDTTPAAAHASSTSEDERLAAVLVRLGPVLKTLGDQSKLPAAESAELQQASVPFRPRSCLPGARARRLLVVGCWLLVVVWWQRWPRRVCACCIDGGASGRETSGRGRGHRRPLCVAVCGVSRGGRGIRAHSHSLPGAFSLPANLAHRTTGTPHDSWCRQH